MKIWDCQQSHSYAEPYTSGKPITTTTSTKRSDQTSSNPNESTASKRKTPSKIQTGPSPKRSNHQTTPVFARICIVSIVASHQHSALDSSIVLDMKRSTLLINSFLFAIIPICNLPSTSFKAKTLIKRTCEMYKYLCDHCSAYSSIFYSIFFYS